MGIAIYCVVCSRKIRSRKYNQANDLTCSECVDLLQRKFSDCEIKALKAQEKKRIKSTKTAVLAKNHDEYIKWLCRKKLCSTLFEYIDLRLVSIWNDSLNCPKDKFIVLKGAKTLNEWKRFESYALEHKPIIILE